MQILKVKSNEEGQRIDKYLRKYLSDAPLSYIYKLFRKKDVKVNGKHCNIDYKIKRDDEIGRKRIFAPSYLKVPNRN